MSSALLLFLSLFAITLPGISIDLFTPSMPAIAQHFQVHPSTVKLSISLFFICYAIGQIVFGTLSDSFGRKPFILIGLFIFVLASILAVYSPSMTVLIIARMIQGFSAATASVITKTMMSDRLSGKKLQVATTYYTIVWSLGPIVAPVIGGYLQFYFDWQANFWFYTLYSLILFATMILLLKETLVKTKRHPFNVATTLKNFKGVLSHAHFLMSITILGMGYCIIIVFNVLGPFLVQDTLHYNAAVYGHVALMIGAGYFVGTSINRLLMKSIATTRIIKIGFIIMLVATFGMLLLAYETKLTLGTIILPTFLIIAADGLIFPNVMGKCLTFFTEKAGVAAAVLGFALTFITGVASFFISFVHAESLVPMAWLFLGFTLIQGFLLYPLMSEFKENN